MVETGRDAMMDIPALKWPEIQRVMYWYTGTVGDEKTGDVFVDSLMVLFLENREGANTDVGELGDMMVRYDPDSGDVIGLEIELFECHFLKEHPELAEDWAAIKPEGNDGFHNSPWLTGVTPIAYACRLREMAYKGTQVPGWPRVDRGDVLLWSKSDVPA